MAKIKLAANPTFKKKVGIPTPDGDLEIEFEFRHKSRDALIEFQQGAAGREDLDVVMEIACNWGYEDEPFGKEAVGTLLQERHAAAVAIVSTYLSSLTQARLGN